MNKGFNYYLEQINQENFWLIPEPKNEYEEFERTAKDKKISLEKLLACFKNGGVIELKDRIWKQLENTDSYNISHVKYEQLAKKYKKDIKSLEAANKLPMPIVCTIKGKPYLIAGNTRLMYSRVENIVPKVWFFDYIE